jgi:maltose alpha-D-glucosyltransferase/alpha-amylase
VLTFIRRYEDEIILVVVNLSRFSQAVELDLSQYADMVPMELFSHNKFPPIRTEPYQITLGRHDSYWFALLPSVPEAEITERPPVTISISSLPHDGLEAEVRERLEQRGLLRYLKRSRWFGSKGRQIRNLDIVEATRLQYDLLPTYLLLIDVEYNEGPSETYQLPVAFALKEQVTELLQNHPRAVIANLDVDDQDGVIVDAVYDHRFQQALLQLIARRRKLKGEAGDMVSSRARSLSRELKEIEMPVDSRILSVEQSNSSILYDEHWVLKLYRRLEKGVNPDAEVGRVLSETAKFEHIPAYKGGIAYRNRAGEQRETALLQQFLANQGDAWTWVLDHVGRYLEYVMSHRRDLGSPPDPGPLQVDRESRAGHELMNDLVGDFQTEMFRLLGQRTAEMHHALAGIRDNRDFTPESFTQLYQRSVYQTMRNLARSVFQLLQKVQHRLDADDRKQANVLLENQNVILSRYRRLLGKKIAAQKIRIHGDYHLGQVLFTGKDFVIIDFEGEPARPLSERRLKRCPLRDVAGMVRSFHYAIFAALPRNPAVSEENSDFVIPWLEAWYHHAATSFLQSYRKTAHDSGLLPKNSTEANTLFEIFLLDKAVYELGYELNNRPDWVRIPLRGIDDILAQSETEERR